MPRKELLKEIEVAGTKVEMTQEGPLFRVTMKDDEGYERTRVFADYAEANALFSSYLEGN